jgi:hypothetical protein
MNSTNYFFNRSTNELEVGEYFDELEEEEHTVLKLVAKGLDYEEIAARFDEDERKIESIGENTFLKLLPVAHLVSPTTLADTPVITSEIKDLILETYSAEMEFRGERANYIRVKGLQYGLS